MNHNRMKRKVKKTTTASAKSITKAPTALSRGQRKRAMKKAVRVAREGFVKTALATKSKNDNVDNLGDALGNFGDMQEAIAAVQESIVSDARFERVLVGPKPKKAKQTGALKKSAKLKSDAVDIERFNKLIEIPEFSADPMAAIERHLQNVRRKKEEKAANKMEM